MHFLERYLVEHPAALYVGALALYALNLALYAHAERLRQAVTLVSAVPPQSLRARLLSTSIGALIFLIPGLFLSGQLRALFAGAFLVMQLGSLALLLSTIQVTHALLQPGAGSGHVEYSQSTYALLSAANLSTVAVLCLAAFALTGSPSFFAASLYLGASSIGFRRRARQHTAKARSEEHRVA